MDIEEFVKDKKLFRQIGWFLGNVTIGRILISRVIAIKFYFQKKISSRDLYRNVLPDKFFKGNDYKKVIQLIEANLLKKIDFTLFGKKIHYHLVNKIILLKDLYNIIILDQYHVRDFIKTDSIVIDAGSNFGIFACLAATIAKEGNVYAFEPVGETFGYLQKNTSHYTNINSFKLAIGEKDKNSEMFFNPDHLYDSSLKNSAFCTSQQESYCNHQAVKVITIDSFISSSHLEKFDFLKIDTESYEKEILRGAKKSIKKFKPTIAVSAYHQKNDKKDIVDLVLSIDSTYKYFLSRRGEDDLIFYH